MAHEMTMIRQGNSLRPATVRDAEQMLRIPPGKPVRTRVTLARSGAQHRFYWELLGRVVDATDRWPTVQHLHDTMRFRLGYVRPVVVLGGGVQYVPDSTAFDRMDGPTFGDYLNRVIDVILSDILPGIGRDELVADIEAMVVPTERRS